MILNIGCGGNPSKYETNVDIREIPGTIRWDLNITPWPFQDGMFEAVKALDIIEHLRDVIPAMEEIHRVLKVGGTVTIRTCLWDTRVAFTDPTHLHFFNEESFDYFCPETFWGQKYPWYSKGKFKKISCRRDGEQLLVVLEKI
jgi:SAM-dependent methyltransferase